MNLMSLSRIHLLLLALLPLADSLAAQTIADFEPASDPKWEARNVAAAIASEAPTQGQAYLKLSNPQEPRRAYVRLPVPADADFAARASLSAQLRNPAGTGEVKLAWLALDAAGRPIFQRRFTLAPGEAWIRLDEPLGAWRWDDRFVGGWDEVRSLALRIDSDAAEIHLDDVRLAGDAQADAPQRWLLDVAFGDRTYKKISDDGLLVATDALEGFSDADLQRLLRDMRQSRLFLRRIFGPAVRPTEQSGSAALLIFSDPAEHRAFFERLGQQWRVTISPPSAQGYTVQDIATSTYRAELGPRRPVYLHESVHAIVARDLRLQSSHEPHTPLQEGLANFVQICAHPQSLKRRVYVDAFARPFDASTGGAFKPLQALFESRATPREYAQLASVVAFLIERKPELLQAIAKGLAEGAPIGQILSRQGTSWQGLQDEWLAWGRARYVDDNGPIFDVPPELR